MEEGLEEELQYAPGLITNMGPIEFSKLLFEKFGGRRATELFGWGVMFGIIGLENGPKLRRALREAGYAQSSIYRALADWREFAEFVEDRYKVKMTVEELVKKTIPEQ